MSYYSILPSQRVGGGTTFSGQNPDPMRPRQVPGGGFRTRDVDPNELSSNQLAAITAEDGILMQRAAAQGLARANSRGLINSSLASGAAQGAVIDAATPFAMQQAGAYTNVGDRNMDAENEYLTNQGTWANAQTIAGMNLDASQQNAILERESREADRLMRGQQFDAEMAANERARAEDTRRYDVDYAREQETAATNDLRGRRNFISSGIFNTIMSDPTLWRDQAGSMGFANYYGQNFSSLWDNLFGTPP